MSNSQDSLSSASRTMLASALLGGTASAISQWNDYQQGEIAIEQMTAKVLKDAARTGLAGGLATAVAEHMAGRPILSFTSLLAAGAATLYLIDELKENSHG
ncbi:hypothetical protein [Sansalvadorimonas verongulae]|uniref:hypothetical protein n=1 Tax=Sansalvadorimonas verongulae TaxID=2172824 RepID=UPI0012BBC6F1|nr:hypothetical protein [Sansalvadorimonas verongulae]MTI13705.1 hypothetical protein [Sansalvadorimonas verongulae]